MGGSFIDVYFGMSFSLIVVVCISPCHVFFWCQGVSRGGDLIILAHPANHVCACVCACACGYTWEERHN